MRGLLLVTIFLLAPVEVSGHAIYSGLTSPDGRKCCNDMDCGPVRTRFNEDSAEVEVYLNGKWWFAFDPRWFIGSSPTGEFHGCMMPTDRIPRCVLGGEGS